MQEDVKLEQQQLELEAEFDQMRHLRESAEAKVRFGGQEWNNLMSEFDVLKASKQSIIDEDFVLEAKRASLQKRFEANAAKKATVVREFDTADGESVQAFSQFEELRSKMESLEVTKEFEELYEKEEGSRVSEEYQEVIGLPIHNNEMWMDGLK